MTRVKKINMKKIDRDMHGIVGLLYENDFNPLACCDGVLDSHENKEEVTTAYFSIFDSQKGRDLAAHFMDISDIAELSVDFSSKPYEPYEFCGNIVDDGRISIHFSNLYSENTKRVYDEICKVISGTQVNMLHRQHIDNIFELFNQTSLIMSASLDMINKNICEIFIDYPECEDSCEFPYIKQALELCSKKFYVKDRLEDIPRYPSVYNGFVLRAEYLEIDGTKVLEFLGEFNKCCNMVPMIPIDWVNIVNNEGDYE